MPNHDDNYPATPRISIAHLWAPTRDRAIAVRIEGNTVRPVLHRTPAQRKAAANTPWPEPDNA